MNLHCFKKDTLAKETLNRLSFLFDNKFCILNKGNQLKKANFVVFTYCEEFDESCTFLKGISSIAINQGYLFYAEIVFEKYFNPFAKHP